MASEEWLTGADAPPPPPVSEESFSSLALDALAHVRRAVYFPGLLAAVVLIAALITLLGQRVKELKAARSRVRTLEALLDSALNKGPEARKAAADEWAALVRAEEQAKTKAA